MWNILSLLVKHGVRVENTGCRRKTRGVKHTESALRTWDPGGKYGV